MDLINGKIILKCERKIAYDSPDHIQPGGTTKDNSSNILFNYKLYDLYSNEKRLKILDFGCSGGGFVKDCIDSGHFAVGLEGSDYSKKFKRAEWRTIPEYLFTCDVTKNFDIFIKNENKQERILFNVITCWEVMEHIKESDLSILTENIKKHLDKNGIWIMSISNCDSIIDGINFHQTIKPKKWWINKFNQLGFIVKGDYEKYFQKQFIRGPYQDNIPLIGKIDCFNLVVTLPKNSLPKIPKESLKRKIWNKIISSDIHKIVKIIITGKSPYQK